jgi:preprotein translocase subunit SecD
MVELGSPTMRTVLVAGFVALAIVIVQMLIGYRKIRFKGRTHLKVHKAIGWTILIIGVAHALLALAYLGWLPL